MSGCLLRGDSKAESTPCIQTGDVKKKIPYVWDLATSLMCLERYKGYREK